MKEARIDGQTVHAEGHYPVEMEVKFLTHLENLSLEKGRTTPMFETDDEIPMLLYVRAIADASSGFEVLIIPTVRAQNTFH